MCTLRWEGAEWVWGLKSDLFCCRGKWQPGEYLSWEGPGVSLVLTGAL